MYKRHLKLRLEQGRSAFLWGARKTGKSTFLSELYPESAKFNLLHADIRLKYTKEPWLFRHEVLALPENQKNMPIIVDEVQKAPAILDEIHSLIEDARCSFVMCGSSARQMKRAGINMLGGRALKYNFYPLVYPEIKDDFNLLKVFNNGLIPLHYMEHDARLSLKSYIEDYLLYEIHAEGLARNLDMFSRFMDSAAFSHGEILNYSNIARDVGINSTTVKEYYQILVDTLIGYLIYPYNKKVGRDIISASPRFYLFDVGIAGRLMQRTVENAGGIEAGRSLEHYVLTELMAYKDLNHLDHEIGYWRTKTGLEVDFVLHTKRGKPLPVEVKISSSIHKSEMKGIKAFMQEYEVQKSYIVCMADRPQKIVQDYGDILVLPLQEFLSRLWGGEIIDNRPC